jgi:hypothetical protein
MDLLYKIFIDPFVQMGGAPDLLVQTMWEGLVAGVLYALSRGFVRIFKHLMCSTLQASWWCSPLPLVGIYTLLRWGAAVRSGRLRGARPHRRHLLLALGVRRLMLAVANLTLSCSWRLQADFFSLGSANSYLVANRRL